MVFFYCSCRLIFSFLCLFCIIINLNHPHCLSDMLVISYCLITTFELHSCRFGLDLSRISAHVQLWMVYEIQPCLYLISTISTIFIIVVFSLTRPTIFTVLVSSLQLCVNWPTVLSSFLLTISSIIDLQLPQSVRYCINHKE